MTMIGSVGTKSAAPAAHAGPSAADLRTAKHVKTAINGLLARVKLGPSLPDAKLPKYDDKAKVERAPNGDPLFAVQLSKPPPAGAADMPTTYALVDPKKNQFYVMTGGGITGKTFGRGPLALPSNTRFQARQYSVGDVKQLGEAAAAKAPPKEKLHHFEASVQAASWSYGSGVRPMPGHPSAGPSINATIVLPYIDIKPEWKVSTDEKTHTITVKLDGVSPNEVHPRAATRPQDINIPMTRPKDVGAEYKIVFEDLKGKQLFSTKFKNMLPA